MNRKKTIFISILVIIALCVAAWFYGYYNHKSNDNLPSLKTVVEMDEGDANALLTGYYTEQLIDVWGEPDTISNNEYVWQINDTLLIVNDNNKGKVVVCGLRRAEQNAVAPNKCLDEVAGNITFYEEPVKEAQNGNGTVTVRLSRDLNKDQADKLKDILDDVDEWVDDRSVDRLAYYFDGDFQFSDREHKYYFTYEYDVIYYDHYFAEIPAEDMQYIKDLGAVNDKLPDIDPIEYTNYFNIEEQVELCKGTADEKSKVTVKFQSTEGPSAFAVEVWHRAHENNEWTKSESKSALIGDAPAFTVPAASEYVVMVTATAGNKGNVTFFVSCS